MNMSMDDDSEDDDNYQPLPILEGQFPHNTLSSFTEENKELFSETS